MLLTETIKNSTSAIKKRRATIESKQHAETYARALAQLSQSTGSIKDTLDCANAIKESGIVEAPVIDEATRSVACPATPNEPRNLPITSQKLLSANRPSRL